jgi:hypothetical protein
MLASFAFARKSWATSLFRLTPTIPGLGITTTLRKHFLCLSAFKFLAKILELPANFQVVFQIWHFPGDFPKCLIESFLYFPE